jgi:hypothetical protein
MGERNRDRRRLGDKKRYNSQLSKTINQISVHRRALCGTRFLSSPDISQTSDISGRKSKTLMNEYFMRKQITSLE